MNEEKTPETPEDDSRRIRSPSFPFISLRVAIDRVRSLEEKYFHHQARMSNALNVWGYNPKSSGGLRTVASLKAYGLIDDSGSGQDRKIRVSKLGLKILKDQRPGIYDVAVKDAALKPKMFSKFKNDWGFPRPPDPEVLSELTLDYKFDESAAKKFLKVYDDTFKFAKLDSSDSLSGGNEDSEEGYDNVPEPPPSRDEKPEEEDMKPTTGQRRAVFALAEGDVIITFPEEMSKESVGDLDDYIKTFLKKARREAGIEEKK